MAKPTRLHKRILPFIEVMKAVFRSLWYLRTTLLIFCIILLLSGLGLFSFEKGICLYQGNQIQTFWEAIYITISVAVGANCNDFTPLTKMGKFLIVFDGLLGFVLLGLVVWAIQYCYGSVSVRVSKLLFLAGKDEAKLE